MGHDMNLIMLKYKSYLQQSLNKQAFRFSIQVLLQLMYLNKKRILKNSMLTIIKELVLVLISNSKYFHIRSTKRKIDKQKYKLVNIVLEKMLSLLTLS